MQRYIHVAAILLLLSLAESRRLNNRQKMRVYRYLKGQYHVDDGMLRSSADEKAHFREFKRVSDMIEDHNALVSTTYKAGYNSFAMMTEAERESHLGLNISEALDLQTRAATLISRQKRGRIPSKINYEKHLVAPKGQGGCGSCWAFGASAALEYAINSRLGKVTSVSEQMWVDCVYADAKRSGCSGGWPASCFNWSRDNGNMIASEKDYPYKIDKDDKGDNCRRPSKYQSALKKLKLGDVQKIDKTDQAMTEGVANIKIGVISTAVAAGKTFFQYEGGVYYEKKCGDKLNHAVTVVGYGVQDGTPFFRLRNSWGSSWGDSGHINMKRGEGDKNVNTCRIAEFGHYPTILGDSPDDDDKDDKDKDDKDKDDKNKDDNKVCSWKKEKGMKLKGSIKGVPTFDSRKKAQKACEEHIEDCAGITIKDGKWELNKKEKLAKCKDCTAYVCK